MRRAGDEARRPELPALLDAGEKPERIDPREIRDAIEPREVETRRPARVTSLRADGDAERDVEARPARTRREQRVQRGAVTILPSPSALAVAPSVRALERHQRGALLGGHAYGHERA